ASLLEHLAQLELHATPHTAQIDGHHAVKVFPGSISSLCDNILNAGIVVGCIEPPESSDRPLDHSFHLSIISYVAADGECFMPLSRQFLGDRTRALLVRSGQHLRSTG